jgi:HTH-type transcriptional regulator, global nitrogen regulator NrpRI
VTQQNQTIKLAILKVLQDLGTPAGAARIVQHLSSRGAHLQPRTIRFYLLQMDHEGLTKPVSRRMGREITAKGRDELAHANIIEKVGFIASRIDALGYRMTFRNSRGAGTIISNISMIEKGYLARALEYMNPVFGKKLGMGSRLAIAKEGEQLAGVMVPKGMVTLGTVCSVTVNGIMLSERIPVTSRFGGLIELRDAKPVRFVELIEYRGTTIDPLEFFINANMTRVRECARTGNGVIGASFREVPSVALDEVRRIGREMERHGLGGILALGKPNQPLLDIPVAEGLCGMIVLGGMNPIAALHEAGAKVTIQSLAGLEDFGSFLPFQVLRNRFPL